MRRVLIIPDCQVPFEDKRSMAAVEQYMADHKWDEVIYLGDFMDFNCISHFNKGLPGNVIGESIAGDYAVGNELLDRHQSIVRKRNPNCKWVMLEGNHEHRVNLYLAEHVELKGSVEVPIGLRLKQRGFKWVPCWSKGVTYRCGNLYFTHGLYTGNNHAKRMTENFGCSIAYGHTHDVMSYPKVLRGPDKTIEGHSLGCLCRYDLSYVGQNPTNWQQAISTLYVLPDGFYNLYVSRIFKHRFVSPEGKLYGAKKKA